MLRKILQVGFFLVLTTGVQAQLVVPGDDFVAGWTRSEKMRRFVKADLFNYIDGGAELFHEFGFEELVVQRYRKDDETLTLEVYRMESSEAALGIYLMKCGQEIPVEGIAVRHSGNRFQFTLVKANYFVLVNNATGNEGVLPVIITLSRCVLASIPEGRRVELFDVLPEENRIAGSELLVRGPYGLQPIYTFGEDDILELRGKVFGVLADYRDKHDVVTTLIVIPYPDAETASSVYRNLVEHLDPYLKIVKREKGVFSFKDYRDEFGTVGVEGRFLRIRLHLPVEPVFNRDYDF